MAGSRSLLAWCAALPLALTVLSATGCTGKSSAQSSAVELSANVKVPFQFVAYGDTRFHDPKDTDAANPAARAALVKAIAGANPAFICFTGDIVFNGYDSGDWNVWDRETSVWREKKIPVYPVLGNHDLHGSEKLALSNYFERFPELKGSRYYSVRAANTMILALDSSMDEAEGPQGRWLSNELDRIPADVDFVFVLLHHPPYTSSSAKLLGGGHSARPREEALAAMLEERQSRAPYRIVLFSGHVHNYERHERGGVTYFVTGGGGAHPYLINRPATDPFQSKAINYHYLLVAVEGQQLTVTMNRLDLSNSHEVWTQPDSVTITPPSAQSRGK